jgi:hypothetical protein
MLKNDLIQCLESPCPLTVSRDTLTCCDAPILVKPSGWTLLMLMTRMACASLPLQRRQLLCQACIFASAWMNQQSDHDLPNKTWLDCHNAACKCLNPAGIEAAKLGETIQRWNQQLARLDKFQRPDPTVLLQVQGSYETIFQWESGRLDN